MIASRNNTAPGWATTATSATDPIQHLIVLMMENHSFDQMLGDATRIYPELEGIPQQGEKFANISSKTGKQFVQTANPESRTQSPDPGHELRDVKLQMGSAAKPMSGFIDSFLRLEGANEINAQQVMDYFPLGDTPAKDSLPALHTLARHFMVCDHWFSSVPGPTWPNRFFAHSGTCLGHVLMPSRRHPENLHKYDQDTIFDRLRNAKRSWRIYHNGLPQSVVLENLWPRLLTGHYQCMAEFYKDVRGPAEEFPDYVFIEPRYFSPDENDQHPPADIALGDQLIASVYNALRGNQALWQSTLLIVVYDEHGGFYDHVTPPKTLAPDSHTKEYRFDQLGMRVPAILVSPWLDAGVCSRVFDHTSILRYLCDKYAMPPLGKRTATAAGTLQSANFKDLLRQRTEPRSDTPFAIKGRSAAKPRLQNTQGAAGVAEQEVAAKAISPVAGSRESLLYFFASKSIEELPPSSRLTRLALMPQSDEGLRALAERKYTDIITKKK